MSAKKFVVELSEPEREVCRQVVKKLKGTSQKVKRANILLKADQGWTDAKIAETALVPPGEDTNAEMLDLRGEVVFALKR